MLVDCTAYDFSGTGGEIPLGLHALTSWRRQPLLYMAVHYRGAGVRIWRRALTRRHQIPFGVPYYSRNTRDLRGRLRYARSERRCSGVILMPGQFGLHGDRLPVEP